MGFPHHTDVIVVRAWNPRRSNSC